MFRFPPPNQQIGFSRALVAARLEFLQGALAEALKATDIGAVDRELAKLAPRKMLNRLAQKGLRGELLFAVPVLLTINPKLVAYYRLILGYSQKEFFTKATGASMFKAAETKGSLGKAIDHLGSFCQALNSAAALLAEGIGVESLSRDLLADLAILTLGPQLRGGANNRRGSDAIGQVFQIVHAIVKSAVIDADERSIVIRNAARREVVIEFAADPDIVIRERMTEGSNRNVVAIEIKGGTDYSNVHNRIGEAEKSHRKARADGYTECWTVVNVPGLDLAMAHKESPTTDRFYHLDVLSIKNSGEYQDFRNRIASLTGIRIENRKR